MEEEIPFQMEEGRPLTAIMAGDAGVREQEEEDSLRMGLSLLLKAAVLPHSPPTHILVATRGRY